MGQSPCTRCTAYRSQLSSLVCCRVCRQLGGQLCVVSSAASWPKLISPSSCSSATWLPSFRPLSPASDGPKIAQMQDSQNQNLSMLKQMQPLVRQIMVHSSTRHFFAKNGTEAIRNWFEQKSQTKKKARNVHFLPKISTRY